MYTVRAASAALPLLEGSAYLKNASLRVNTHANDARPSPTAASAGSRAPQPCRRERRRARHGARGSAGGPRHSIWQAGPAGARARAARQLRVGIAAEGEAAGVLGDAADEVLVLVALVAARPPEVRQGCEHAVQRGTTPAALPTEAGLLGLVLAPSLAVRRHLPGVRVRGAHLALVVRARSLVCCQRVEINDGLGAQLRRHGTLQMAARRERSKHTQVQWKDLC
mmetsp:Transcript_26766/g.69992  ORF Transcript_26766/g.69992 Transcript_26766/m.69992 type:complete len:224 (+) Transcript_26766:344-1015(+)